MQRRILVTGGSGFIGTNVLAHYLAQGVPVANLDIRPPRNAAQAAVWQPCDILDRSVLEHAFQAFRPTHVLHLAARTDLDGVNVLGDYAANVAGVEHVLDVVSDRPTIRRTVYASSRMVCDIAHQPTGDDDFCPNTVYGESKVAGERLVRARADQRASPWVIVRPASIWGPWFDVPYRDFFTAIARGRYVHPGRTQVRKSFGYVGNTVHQLDRMLTADAAAVAGRTFYLADWPPLIVEEWARDIQQALRAKPIRRAPMPLLRGVAVAGDLLESAGRRKAPLTTFRLNNLMTTMVYDSAALEAVVGDLPFTRQQGVAETVAWMRRPQAA